MEGTATPTPVVTNRSGRQAKRPLTREEWLDRDTGSR